LALIAVGTSARAQTDQYKRAKPAPVKADGAKPTDPKAVQAPAQAVDDKSDKVDITDIEQKYWAPKDTDFSVVQNRNYNKAGRLGVSAMTGPVVNETFSDGLNTGVRANYYFDERYGVEFSYIQSDLSDNDATKNFKRNLSGGAVAPDFNRPDSYVGLGLNWVPIYAKVSLLGKKILYFDLQVTPHIGYGTYLQQTDGSPVATDQRKSTFMWGVDITQYYFLSQEIALRFDLHNRWFSQDILEYSTGNFRRSETQQTTMFLLGVTYFF